MLLLVCVRAGWPANTSPSQRDAFPALTPIIVRRTSCILYNSLCKPIFWQSFAKKPALWHAASIMTTLAMHVNGILRNSIYIFRVFAFKQKRNRLACIHKIGITKRSHMKILKPCMTVAYSKVIYMVSNDKSWL